MPFNEVRINTAVDGFGKRSGAVERVHGDYTNTSGPRMLEELAERGVLPKGFELGSKRGAILNVWRNASPVAVQQKPLAVLDARTVDEKDLGLYYVRANPNPDPDPDPDPDPSPNRRARGLRSSLLSISVAHTAG